jgi:micrococcal nuclease
MTSLFDMIRSRVLSVGALVTCAVSALGWWIGDSHRRTTPSARVIEATDGDTVVVVLEHGKRDTVRILGVDTPETHHPTKGVECFGPEAAAFTARRLTGHVVRLEPDVEARDLYGRRLAHVIVDGHRFSDELLRRGFARLLVIDPNRTHARELLRAELDARNAERGLWAVCE